MYKPALVKLADIAGDKITIVTKFCACLVRHAPVAGEHVGALDLEHTHRTLTHRRAAIEIDDTQRHSRQRQPDRARHALAAVRVRGINTGLAHAVAFKYGVTGACQPVTVGLNEQRRRTRDKQAHLCGAGLVELRMLQQPHIVGRHAHKYRRGGQVFHDGVDIERRQQNHRGTRRQRDVDGDEQPMDVKQRQRMQQDIAGRVTPTGFQAIGVRGQISVREHRTLGAARGTGGVENRRQIFTAASDVEKRGLLRVGALSE